MVIRDEDKPSIVINTQPISDAAKQSMTEAEIRNIAARRAEKMAAISAWSSPAAMAARREQHDKEAAAALERGRRMADYAKEVEAASKMFENEEKMTIKVTPLVKQEPVIVTDLLDDPTWYQRLIVKWRKRDKNK